MRGNAPREVGTIGARSFIFPPTASFRSQTQLGLPHLLFANKKYPWLTRHPVRSGAMTARGRDPCHQSATGGSIATGPPIEKSEEREQDLKAGTVLRKEDP